MVLHEPAMFAATHKDGSPSQHSTNLIASPPSQHADKQEASASFPSSAMSLPPVNAS
jgi:hypothetical protein